MWREVEQARYCGHICNHPDNTVTNHQHIPNFWSPKQETKHVVISTLHIKTIECEGPLVYTVQSNIPLRDLPGAPFVKHPSGMAMRVSPPMHAHVTFLNCTSPITEHAVLSAVVGLIRRCSKNSQLWFHEQHVHHTGINAYAILYYKSGHEQNKNENLFHMVLF
jgi:hypothetical protein